MSKSKSSKGFAVFEEVLFPVAQCLSLEEAFHEIMTRCGYAPVWDQDSQRMRLRFRYLEGGSWTGFFAIDLEAESDVKTMEHPISDGLWLSRLKIMQRVVYGGLKCWRALEMDSFYIQHSIAEQKMRRFLEREGSQDSRSASA